jgi:hypothetical protein
MMAACSGGGSGTGTPVPTPFVPVTTPLQQTSFTFAPPAVGTQSSARRPAYLTNSIQSVKIVLGSVNGSAPPAGITTSVTSNITISSCPCTVPGPGVPPGSDQFTVTSYDAQNGGGNVVSTATATYTIVAGVANNNTITLNGVPAQFAFGTMPAATAGTAFASPQAFTLSVKDVDGHAILGTYATSVTVSDPDTSNAALGTTIAVNGGTASHSVTSTSSSDTFTLNYGGLAMTPVSISASASGATTASAAFTPTLQPMVYTPGTGANPTGQEIDLYALTGTGSSGSFSVSEAGYSNAPYNMSFSSSLTGCGSIATASPPSGTSFTATVVASPSAGTCTLSINDGGLHAPLNVTLTYTTSSFGVQ